MAMREIKYKYFYQNDETGRMWSKVFTLGDLTCGALNHYNDEVGSIPVITGVQYTGLKDKNGVEIYEGDIINKEGIGHYKDIDEKAIIEFINGNFYMVYSEDDKELLSNMIIKKDFIFVEYEVIGNIYENKEPLEQ